MLAVAIGVFATGGYAAPTAAIAARAGISEPYLYRLFGTKRQLFLACHDGSVGSSRRRRMPTIRPRTECRGC